MLVGEVPIELASLYVGDATANIFITFSFGRCVISSNDNLLLESLLKTFENAYAGTPIDCDDLPVQCFSVMEDAKGSYSFERNGMAVSSDLSHDEAAAILVQDISDWMVSILVRDHTLLHTASNVSGDGVVLCMGASGSGKTSL